MDTEALLDNIPVGLADDIPVVMLNLFQWHEKASYPYNDSNASCSGEEAYLQRYIATFHSIASNYGGSTLVYIGKPAATLVGPDGNKWDVAALVKYPSISAFRQIVGSDEYKADAAPHRIAALKD